MRYFIALIIAIITTALFYFFGPESWVWVISILLTPVFLIALAGGHLDMLPNSEIGVAIIVTMIIAAIVIPQTHDYYNRQAHKILMEAVEDLNAAQLRHFEKHKKYSSNLEALNLSLPEEISLKIIDKGKGIIVECRHREYDKDYDGKADIIIWKPKEPVPANGH
jgi:uncharacterized membrane protein YccC